MKGEHSKRQMLWTDLRVYVLQLCDGSFLTIPVLSWMNVEFYSMLILHRWRSFAFNCSRALSCFFCQISQAFLRSAKFGYDIFLLCFIHCYTWYANSWWGRFHLSSGIMILQRIFNTLTTFTLLQTCAYVALHLNSVLYLVQIQDMFITFSGSYPRSLKYLHI